MNHRNKRNMLVLTLCPLIGLAQNPDLPYDSGSDGSDGALLIPGTLGGQYSASMVWDSARQEAILYGGRIGGGIREEMLRFSPQGWETNTPPNSPGGRWAHTMAFDAERGETVFFGGSVNYRTSFSYLRDDTWVWNGLTWTQKNPAQSPSRRYGHQMVFDVERKEVVLFGGSAGGGETWTWDGVNWTLESPSTSPSPRLEHVMAYDEGNKEIVLFGGSGGSGETWTWDGADWNQESPATSPSSRMRSTMAYDSERGEVVLFGGYNTSTGTKDNETWVWSGGVWAKKDPATVPPAREYAMMAFDDVNNLVILTGGSGDGSLGDTWVWDGLDWTKRADNKIRIDMSVKPNGIWNYTSIFVGENVTVDFIRNAANTPVVWLASEGVIIDGTIDLNGEHAQDALLGEAAAGGPGGFDGGMGGVGFPFSGTPGQGPGGGLPGITEGQIGQGATHLSTYGNAFLQPLIGGSGGGGAAAETNDPGSPGGAGGGAILIASSKDIELGGAIHVRGGNRYRYNNASSRPYSGGGSGGAIRLAADRVTGGGSLSANGGSGGESGRIRIEAYVNNLTGSGGGSVSPLASVSVPLATQDFGAAPTLMISSIAGEPVPQPPTGSLSSPDVVFNTAGDITITVTAANIPDGTPVTCRVTSGSSVITLPVGDDPAIALSGGIATFTTTVPPGVGTVQAFTSFSSGE